MIEKPPGPNCAFFWQDEASGYLYDGQKYATPSEVILDGMLGFCGCGMPGAALRFLRDLLRQIAEVHEAERGMPFEAAWKKLKDLIPDAGARYFIYYTLDLLDLTEHGGSVPGWLDGRGYQILEMLEEIDLENDI